MVRKSKKNETLVKTKKKLACLNRKKTNLLKPSYLNQTIMLAAFGEITDIGRGICRVVHNYVKAVP